MNYLSYLKSNKLNQVHPCDEPIYRQRPATLQNFSAAANIRVMLLTQRRACQSQQSCYEKEESQTAPVMKPTPEVRSVPTALFQIWFPGFVPSKNTRK